MPQIGLLGHGSWGRQHARVLRELGALKWVYDSDPHATLVPEGTSILAKVLEDPEVKGVVIATPPATHAELASAAIHAGKAVLIEKPMAMTTLSAQLIGSLARAKGVPLMVGHLMRFHEWYMGLLTGAYQVGLIEYLYSHRLQPGWVRSDVSCLWSLAPHDVDMMIGVAGMPVAVSCTQGIARTTGLADIITATMEFEHGVRGHIFISWLHPEKSREFSVIGQRGMMTMNQQANAEPLKIELQHFLACIEGKMTPMVTAQDGINVVRVLEACDESMQNDGGRVEL